VSVAAGALALSARDALRTATAAAHERLHHVPVFVALAEGRLTRGEYAALLGRLHGFHAAMEAGVAEVRGLEAFGLDPAERRRAWLLREDLAVLGAEVPGEMAVLPAFGSAAAAMGGLYVTEGATLGGKMLARGLDGLLQGSAGRRFLLGHGAGHGEMWRGFCEALERCGAEPARRAEMLCAANACFAAFEAWFG
jgi:heme oxygenase